MNYKDEPLTPPKVAKAKSFPIVGPNSSGATSSGDIVVKSEPLTPPKVAKARKSFPIVGPNSLSGATSSGHIVVKSERPKPSKATKNLGIPASSGGATTSGPKVLKRQAVNPPYKGPVKCLLCLKNLKNHRGYKIHLGRMHSAPTMCCLCCYKSFKQRKVQILHGQEQLKKGHNVCLLCQNTKFHNKMALKSHLMMHMIDMDFYSACPVCTEILMPSTTALEHFEKHHSVSVIKTEVVDTTEDNLITHADEDGYQCQECGFSFIDEPMLKKHLNIIHKIEDANAYIENKGTNFVPGEISAPIYVCDECYTYHKTKELFNMHFRTHGLRYLESRRNVGL